MGTIDDLREHLFATLKALRDPDNPMDLQRAKTIAEVAQVAINSAKVEVEAMKVTDGAIASGFLERLEAPKAPNSPEDEARLRRQRMRQLA